MTQIEAIADKLTAAERDGLHSGFIAHDMARHQLSQVITILGADAATLRTLLEQCRDGFDILPKAVRAHLTKDASI